MFLGMDPCISMPRMLDLMDNRNLEHTPAYNPHKDYQYSPVNKYMHQHYFELDKLHLHHMAMEYMVQVFQVLCQIVEVYIA